jgi:hypothetical protein
MPLTRCSLFVDATAKAQHAVLCSDSYWNLIFKTHVTFCATGDRLVQEAKSTSIMSAGIIALLFIVLALVGSFVVSRQMNKTADNHSMSAGRSGDQYPNRINEQSTRSARGSSATTGSTTGPR